jgi:hypothetical protein
VVDLSALNTDEVDGVGGLADEEDDELVKRSMMTRADARNQTTKHVVEREIGRWIEREREDE